jgi:hypothetical protein
VISLKQYPTVGPFVLIISFQKETSLTYLGKHILLVHLQIQGTANEISNKK